jgi:transcriptional regulator with XRE-family HTH domain
MGIHQRFGGNLRSHCNNFNSIGEVCQGIGINRQQFNRYLAGTSLPNRTTLRRISKYLGVPEESLFEACRDTPLTSSSADPPSQPSSTQPTRELLEALRRFTDGTDTTAKEALAQGLYFCYFPLQASNSYLMRTLVAVKSLNAGTVFSRLTVFPTTGGRPRYLARGKHRGLVLANSQDIYLIGLNQLPPHQISYIVLERMMGNALSMYSGLSVTRTATEVISSRVCLVKAGRNVTIRDALRMLGPVPHNDPSVRPIVSQLLLDAAVERHPNQIRRVNFTETLTRNLESPLAIGGQA